MTDGPGDHGNNERCQVEALRPLTVTAKEYDNEDYYDYVTVNNVPYKSSFPSQGVSMNKGATWMWTSDGSVTRQGYTLCAASEGSEEYYYYGSGSIILGSSGTANDKPDC